VVAAACVFVLTLAIAAKALAVSMAEYALLLALIAVALTVTLPLPVPPNAHGLHAAASHLQAYAEGAAVAHLNGKRSKESAALGKVLGGAKAMLAVTSTCSADDELTTRLQQIQQVATQLKARAAHPTCKPDGVVGDKEQCDPLAHPTGCPILTLPSFCNDDCACAAVPSQPVPCDLPFPAACNAACQCQPSPSACAAG
jgi:hypothetical protein